MTEGQGYDEHGVDIGVSYMQDSIGRTNSAEDRHLQPRYQYGEVRVTRMRPDPPDTL
ncbi:hypothetical protein ACFV0C_38295 [Streptomyces sp. NPDC059568]|uniref:hypothetical protein n=1 Tax=unclassified Streptomyces TaxID=2593676 RepID=UPI00365B4E25